MTDCCERMKEARDKKIVLPRYYSPDENTCDYDGLQMWTREVPPGKYRETGMLMNYCPWCGKELHRER